MVFIIGGSYQGKRDYALQAFGLQPNDVFTCTEDTLEIDLSKRVIEHIERFALGCVKRNAEPKEYWKAHMGELKDKILISDDVSCGVVPIDATIRAWREVNGRANNDLAREADQVIRVFCGLGQVIKG